MAESSSVIESGQNLLLNGRQNFYHDSVAEGLNYTMICRRVCKCGPLLRFNALNLAKIVCFAKWVKGAKCVSSDVLNEKMLMILTCIMLKIMAQLNFLLFFFCSFTYSVISTSQLRS